MKTLIKWLTAAAVLGSVALLAPSAQATESAYCGITWGSLPKNGGALSPAPLTNVRGGRHDCYDRLVMDIRGAENGFQVRYVSQVYDQGGTVIPLRGGAFLEIVLLDPAYDDTGASTYDPANPQELVNVSGWRTFRQVAWAAATRATRPSGWARGPGCPSGCSRWPVRGRVPASCWTWRIAGN